MNQNQRYFSLDALKRHLETLETHPDLGKFVIQQEEIQRLLFSLILCRLAPTSINLKKWLKKNEKLITQLSNSALGQLIKMYTPLTTNEKALLNKLEDYRKRRNKLLHKSYEFRSGVTPDLKRFIEETMSVGNEIEKNLHKLLVREENLV